MSKRNRQTPGHFSRPIEQVLQNFDVNTDQGLSDEEVRRRRERNGPNRLRETKRRGAGRILIEQFKSMVIIVLVIAGAVAFSFQHWAEGIAIAAVLLVNAGIGFLTESAEKETTPLQKRLDQLGRRLAWITLALAAAIAGIGLLTGQETEKMIETAIALGVAAIPEGLPIVATNALARGVMTSNRCAPLQGSGCPLLRDP